MKATITRVSFCLFVTFTGTCVAQDDSPDSGETFPVLVGPYLGQTPPGMEPEIFAPDVLVKPKQAHSNIVFSKSGTECYWCHNGIWFSRLDKGRWTVPSLVPFSNEKFSDDAPFLTPDGKRLLFTSKRPMNESDTSKKESVWVVDRLDNGWSEARPLPPVINEVFQHWQVSEDSMGTLYFGHRPTLDSDQDLYCSRFENGEYQKPEPLGDMINSDHDESNPYISPKGDYLIFTRRNNNRLEDGSQDVSLFISFKLQNDNWSQAIDLREHLNFKSIGNCAIVSQDGKYLFFLDAYEGRYQRYWISANIIDDVKASHPDILQGLASERP